MRILYLLLIVCLCLVSAKYLPDETHASRALLSKYEKSTSDESTASTEQQQDDDNDTDEDSTERKIREEHQKLLEKIEKARQKHLEKQQEARRKYEEKQRKLQEQREENERKYQERLEKEKEKQLKLREKEEKKRIKQEEEQRKLHEKEEQKRQEEIQKQNEQVEAINASSVESIESAENDTLDLEDVWKNHVYKKYGLTPTSTKLEKKAAVYQYWQELGVNANSTQSERRQAVTRFIQNKMQNRAAYDNFVNQFLTGVNVQQLQANLDRDIEKLNNQSSVLKNITLPWASMEQGNIEEKKTLLQTISQFLSSSFTNRVNGVQSTTGQGSVAVGAQQDTHVRPPNASGTGTSTTWSSSDVTIAGSRPNITGSFDTSSGIQSTGTGIAGVGSISTAAAGTTGSVNDINTLESTGGNTNGGVSSNIAGSVGTLPAISGANNNPGETLNIESVSSDVLPSNFATSGAGLTTTYTGGDVVTDIASTGLGLFNDATLGVGSAGTGYTSSGGTGPLNTGNEVSGTSSSNIASTHTGIVGSVIVNAATSTVESAINSATSTDNIGSDSAATKVGSTNTATNINTGDLGKIDTLPAATIAGTIDTAVINAPQGPVKIASAEASISNIGLNDPAVSDSGLTNTDTNSVGSSVVSDSGSTNTDTISIVSADNAIVNLRPSDAAGVGAASTNSADSSVRSTDVIVTDLNDTIATDTSTTTINSVASTNVASISNNINDSAGQLESSSNSVTVGSGTAATDSSANVGDLDTSVSNAAYADNVVSNLDSTNTANTANTAGGPTETVAVNPGSESIGHDATDTVSATTNNVAPSTELTNAVTSTNTDVNGVSANSADTGAVSMNTAAANNQVNDVVGEIAATADSVAPSTGPTNVVTSTNVGSTDTGIVNAPTVDTTATNGGSANSNADAGSTDTVAANPDLASIGNIVNYVVGEVVATTDNVAPGTGPSNVVTSTNVVSTDTGAVNDATVDTIATNGGSANSNVETGSTDTAAANPDLATTGNIVNDVVGEVVATTDSVAPGTGPNNVVTSTNVGSTDTGAVNDATVDTIAINGGSANSNADAGSTDTAAANPDLVSIGNTVNDVAQNTGIVESNNNIVDNGQTIVAADPVAEPTNAAAGSTGLVSEIGVDVGSPDSVSKVIESIDAVSASIDNAATSIASTDITSSVSGSTDTAVVSNGLTNTATDSNLTPDLVPLEATSVTNASGLDTSISTGLTNDVGNAVLSDGVTVEAATINTGTVGTDPIVVSAEPLVTDGAYSDTVNIVSTGAGLVGTTVTDGELTGSSNNETGINETSVNSTRTTTDILLPDFASVSNTSDVIPIVVSQNVEIINEPTNANEVATAVPIEPNNVVAVEATNGAVNSAVTAANDSIIPSIVSLDGVTVPLELGASIIEIVPQ